MIGSSKSFDFAENCRLVQDNKYRRLNSSWSCVGEMSSLHRCAPVKSKERIGEYYLSTWVVPRDNLSSQWGWGVFLLILSLFKEV